MKNEHYDELIYKMDKWMPDDENLQDEYYAILNNGIENNMIDFIWNNADYDQLQRYYSENNEEELDITDFAIYIYNSQWSNNNENI